MENKNPATPPSGATPGSDEKVITTPSSETTNNNGDQSEGKVSISLKEYRDLQRAKARTLSFDKRVALRNQNNNQGANPQFGENADPDLVNKFNESEKARQEAERKALQLEVRGRVRDLLEKDEYKILPKSTKELILKNPAMLSQAENLEEAMLDIEDFISEQVAGIDKVPLMETKTNQNQSAHETPTTVGSGSPAPAGNADLEDTSKLSGPARSMAMIRNSLKTKKVRL